MPLGLNFGGIMQNWALQRTLQDLGHTPITLHCKWVADGSWLHNMLRFIFHNSKNAIKLILGNPFRLVPYSPYRTRKIVSRFIDENIALTGVCKILEPVPDCDAYVVGSDQVWRPDFVRDITEMYLNFVKSGKVIKIAYAASFGTDTWAYTPIQTDLCRNLVASFKAVSVRENSGIALCSNNLDINAVPTLDPTLLVDMNSYLSLLSETPVRKADVGTYILDQTREKHRIVKYVSRSCGARIRNINPYAASVEEWLAMFRDSSFIVTDSFHGCVFSILFKKDFVVIGNIGRGLSRFYDLLGAVGLENRIIYNQDELSKVISCEIDWDKVYGILNTMKEESRMFLINNLK